MRQLLAALDGDVQQIYDAAGVDFRPRFFPIVRSLLESAPRRVGDLAAEVGVSQPAATQTLAEMARLGLVSLSRAEDRRARRVDLTEEGRRVAARLEPLWSAIASAAEGLDRELPCPLMDSIGQALAALDRRPFHQRIRDAMNDA